MDFITTGRESATCDCEAIHGDIVSEVAGIMPDEGKFRALAELYRVFSDPSRIKILWALNCREMCVCDLAALLNITKSAVSHQLKSLRLANLAKYRRQGKVVFYSLADDHVKEIFEKGMEHIRHSH